MDTHSRMETARAVLTALGISGAAVTLAMAAAVPAFAAPADTDRGNGHAAAQSQGDDGDETDSDQASTDDTDGDETSADDTDTDSGEGAATGSEHARATARHADQADAGAAANAAGTTGHNPPGNNGTVFIHDVAGDQSPHNVPHVACNFYVDLFGFDAGQSVTISFAGQAPTGMGTPLGGSWTGVASDDDAGGAGNDFDLELPFTADQLGVTALGDPAHQGYHVKMTVATGQPQQSTHGKKTKVFWIEPCAGQPLVGATGLTGAAGPVNGVGEELTTGADEELAAGAAGETSGGATVQAAATAQGADSPATVLGMSVTRAGTPAVSAASGSLPFTGAELGGLAAAGALALGGGIGLTLTGRRRRRALASNGLSPAS